MVNDTKFWPKSSFTGANKCLANFVVQTLWISYHIIQTLKQTSKHFSTIHRALRITQNVQLSQGQNFRSFTVLPLLPGR